MMYGIPVLIFIFAVYAPGGVALYWTVSNAYQVLQTYFLNNPFKIIAEREAVVQAQKDLENRKKKSQEKGSENEIIRRDLVMVVFTGSTVEEAIQKGLKELDIPRNERLTSKSFLREKNGFLGLFGKKPAQVDIEAISETTVIKANQQAVKGVPKEINEQK